MLFEIGKKLKAL